MSRGRKVKYDLDLDSDRLHQLTPIRESTEINSPAVSTRFVLHGLDPETVREREQPRLSDIPRLPNINQQPANFVQSDNRPTNRMTYESYEPTINDITDRYLNNDRYARGYGLSQEGAHGIHHCECCEPINKVNLRRRRLLQIPDVDERESISREVSRVNKEGKEVVPYSPEKALESIQRTWSGLPHYLMNFNGNQPTEPRRSTGIFGEPNARAGPWGPGMGMYMTTSHAPPPNPAAPAPAPRTYHPYSNHVETDPYYDARFGPEPTAQTLDAQILEQIRLANSKYDYNMQMLSSKVQTL